jgi:hypothetical protein
MQLSGPIVFPLSSIGDRLVGDILYVIGFVIMEMILRQSRRPIDRISLLKVSAPRLAVPVDVLHPFLPCETCLDLAPVRIRASQQLNCDGLPPANSFRSSKRGANLISILFLRA